MDQEKIGRFIAERRRKLGLTQKQLAEPLHVTDKTVSKWETGVRLPDAAMLPELSSVLKTDINELLAGEAFLTDGLSPEEYAQKAQHNLVDLVGELNEIDKRGRSRTIGTAAGVLLSAAALLYLFLFSLRTGRVTDLIDLPTLLYLLGLKLAILSITGWFHDYRNAWKMCLPGRRLSEKELGLAKQAVKYAGALTLSLGSLLALLGLFSLLNYTDGPGIAGPSLAQVLPALLYTAVLKTAYVILSFRLERGNFRKGE